MIVEKMTELGMMDEFLEAESSWAHHTPPTLTPSSYGNVLQKRARMHDVASTVAPPRSRSGSLEAVRSATELERAGVLTTAQKDALKALVQGGDATARSALGKFHQGDSSELERLMQQGHLETSSSSSTSVASSYDKRHRAASIDLLAELDLDGMLSDYRPKPTPSAEMGSSCDDQLMGFEMEMPFFSNLYQQDPQPKKHHHHHHHHHQAPARKGCASSVGSFEEESLGSYAEERPRSAPMPVEHHHDDEDTPSPSCSIASASSAHRGGARSFRPNLCFGGKTAPPGGRCPPAPSSGKRAACKKGKQPFDSLMEGVARWSDEASYSLFADQDLVKPKKIPTAAKTHQPDAIVVAYAGKVSSTITVPPPATELVTGPAPPYETLINFPRAKSRAQIHCVMCGRHPKTETCEPPSETQGGAPPGADDDLQSRVVVIPRQNKDVCRECDKALWRHLETNTHFKWCKGCKRFRNLTAFAEKLAASKCDRCRERGRQGYMRRKGGGGSGAGAGGGSSGGSPPTTPACDDDDPP